jgi:tripartite-type tricarboxylate transporter receptor subunit TctC
LFLSRRTDFTKKYIACLLTATLCSLSSFAQSTYPNKPVKLMVCAGAGGGTDIIARLLAEKMNRPGFRGGQLV